MFRKPVLSCLLSAALFACPASADEIRLKNGDRLTGEITGFDGTRLTLKTAYSGTIRLPAKAIAGIATDGPVTLRIDGTGWATGRLVTDYAGAIRVVREGRTVTGPLDLAKVSRLSPGRDIPRGFRWTGRVNVGGTQRSGNTDTKTLHVDGEATGRSEKDRIRARGEFNREFDNGNRTVDNFTAGVQHDHFVARKVFFYTRGRLERDTPADLRLRTTVGTGAGYQIFETAQTKLSVQAGPAYIHEDNDSSADNDYIALQWNVEFEQDVWNGLAMLFHHHEGTVEADDTQNMFVDSSTGLRVPLADRLNATAQLDLNWDRQPAPGTSSLDKVYLVTLGYSW